MALKLKSSNSNSTGFKIKNVNNAGGLKSYFYSAVITNGLQVYLDAGNISSYGGSGTTWYDLSGNNRNASLINTPTYSGTAGGMFTFSDTSFEYATIPDIGSLTQFTVEAWARVQKSLTGKVTAIVTNQFNLSTSLNYSLGTNRSPTSYNMTFGYYDGSWRNPNGFAPSLNTWYHMVGTYDGSTIKLYVNNVFDTQLVYTGTPSSGGEIRIARRWDESAVNASNYFDGDVAQVRIYNRALNATEISYNYNAHKGRYGL